MDKCGVARNRSASCETPSGTFGRRGGAKLMIKYAPFSDAAVVTFELKRALEKCFPGVTSLLT